MLIANDVLKSVGKLDDRAAFSLLEYGSRTEVRLEPNFPGGIGIHTVDGDVVQLLTSLEGDVWGVEFEDGDPPTLVIDYLRFERDFCLDDVINYINCIIANRCTVDNGCLCMK